LWTTAVVVWVPLLRRSVIDTLTMSGLFWPNLSWHNYDSDYLL
jgi:hypothetical protein